MRKNKVLAGLVASVVAIVLAAGAPGAAFAASTTVSSSTQNVTGFINWNTTRTSTGYTSGAGTNIIRFSPGNLLRQNSSGTLQLLIMRLNKTDNSALTGSQSWDQTEIGTGKNLISGLSTGYNFRLGTSGYNANGAGDTSWSGTLFY